MTFQITEYQKNNQNQKISEINDYIKRFCRATKTDPSVLLHRRDFSFQGGFMEHSTYCSVESGHMGLVTKLTHADSGQWQSSLLVMPLQ
jgi:hypothetical protein